MFRRTRGLTLIELAVTVAVVAVLASVSYPGMSDFIDRQRLVGQALDISDLAQTARSEAIKRSAAGPSESKSIAMTVNPGAPWSVGLANGTAGCSGVTCVINQGGASVRYLVGTAYPDLNSTPCPGCTMTSPAANTPAIVMTFNFRGIVNGAAEQTITIQSPKGKQLSIRVSRLGRISTCSPGALVSGYPSC